jgi:hypothetical protein
VRAADTQPRAIVGRQARQLDVVEPDRAAVERQATGDEVEE